MRSWIGCYGSKIILLKVSRPITTQPSKFVLFNPGKEEKNIMSEQVLFVGTYAVPEGRLEEFIALTRQMAEFVRANEPRIIRWNTYINEQGSEATTIMLHPDSASLEFHLEIAHTKISSNVQFVQTRRIELYGKPSQGVVERLRRISEMSGDWPVIVKTYLDGLPEE
jgi:hypothetical protein